MYVCMYVCTYVCVCSIPKDTYYDYQQEEGDDAQEKIAKAKPKNGKFVLWTCGDFCHKETV